MEPTSSPDNARPQRGLARFWPVNRDGEDETGAPDSGDMSIAHPSETEMVALGSRRGVDEVPVPLSPGTPGGPSSPVASATPGPRGPEGTPKEPLSGGSPSSPLPGSPAGSSSSDGPPRPPARDQDHSGPSLPRDDAGQTRESWEENSGTFGGFDLGGRNGRFLFGGRNTAEPPRGLNGHAATELNGRTRDPAATGSTVDGPVPPSAAKSTAEPAPKTDENGRDDMSARPSGPGFPATGDPSAAGPGGTPESAANAAGRRRDLGDAADLLAGRRRELGDPAAAPITPAPPPDPPRRQATGWASVPTTTNPVVSPTSASPTPDSPASASAPVSGSAYDQPPTYVPGLPDPTSGPVSGVPAPRAGASVPVPAPAPTSPTSPAAYVPAEKIPVILPSEETTADEEATSPRTPSPRRSASLEDAEPARRGRRAAPDPDDDLGDDGPLRPGDVAAGQIAFWDDDATQHFRAAWHEVKAEFVDDPVAALTRAHDLLTDAVNELTEALLAERDELDPLRGTATPDTESMRMAMRGYREFLDRILAL